MKLKEMTTEDMQVWLEKALGHKPGALGKHRVSELCAATESEPFLKWMAEFKKDKK